MSSITMPSTLSSGIISSSQYGVTLSPSPASCARSSSQICVALSSSQTDSTVPSNLRSVKPSSSQSRITLPLSQLPVTPFTTITTLQETIQRLFKGTTSNAVKTFQILNSSIPFDGTTSRPYYTNSGTDSTIVETNTPTLMRDQTLSLFLTQSKSPFHKSVSLNSKLIANTVGQASHNLASTSSLTSGNSTSVISPTIFQLQSAEISRADPAMSGNSFQGTVGLSTKTSASLKLLLSVTGDIPLSRVTSLTISRSSTNEKSSLSNVSYEDSLVTDKPIGTLTINSLHQETMQKTGYISLHSIANIPSQTSLTGIASHAADSTYSTSTASISSCYQSVPSSSDSWNYHLYSNSKSSSSKAYSSTFVDYRITDPLGTQSVPIWNRSTIAIVSFSGKTNLISDKFSSLSRTSGNI